MDKQAVGDTKPSSSSSSSRHSRRKPNTSSSTRERGDEDGGSKKNEEDVESRDRRIKRREKEDRDSKRKSRSIDASVPGAHASTGEHRSSRKSSESKDHSSRSSRRSTDEKSAHRSSRGSATTPGAQAEHLSPKSPKSSRSRRSDEKAKERRGTRASKPGAEASTSSPRDRSKTKSSGSGRSRKRDGNNVSPLSDSARSSVPSEQGLPDIGTPPFNESGRSTVAKSDGLPYIGEASDDGDPLVAATLIDEDIETKGAKKNNKGSSSNEQARIEEALATERQRNDAENQRLRDELERVETERKEKEEKAKKRNRIVCAIILVLVLIGAGIAAFFALQGGSSSDPTPVNNPDKDEKQETLGPSVDPSTSPSSDSTTVPTGVPTVPLKYQPPSDLECERIASGLPLDGENEMFDRGFAIAMEVDLLEGNGIDPQVPELESQIKKLLVPDLIGCDRDFFNNRRLDRHHDDDQAANHNNASISMSAHPRRQLQSARIRYAIAKAIATVTVTDNACEKSDSPNCSVVTANLDLKIRGEEQVIFLAGVIGEIFPNGVDIRPELELGTPFEAVVIGIIRSLDPTQAPTIAPTGIASENPSGAPSNSPSTSPTLAPAIGPTTPSPTKTPTKAPAPPPTLAPTSTPPPTFAPQPGPSPAPTPPPTKSPTIAPSKSPTKSPTRNPSVAPSPSPSIQASAAPSPVPTSGPSSVPSSSPTTPAPTSIYLGCFRDDAINRVMDVNVGGTFDVNGCRVFCRNAGYPYSAIQAGIQCFCGNNYDSLGAANNCDGVCYDPNDQECGGVDANSVYMSGTLSTASDVPALDSDLNCGCFADLSFIARDLPHYSSYIFLTQIGCINYCRSQGYSFAGVQWNSQCFCGDDPGSYGTSLNCFTVDKDRDGDPDLCFKIFSVVLSMTSLVT